MWFEILPSALIIYGAFSLSSYGTLGIHKLVFNNPHKRDMRLFFNRRIYLRDRRLMNNPYLMNDLETITGDVDDDKFKPPEDKASKKSGAQEISSECTCKLPSEK